MSTIRVDRITPYQSGSITIEGLNLPNTATTGSNTFVGDQNIQGKITASIQEGYVLVGGAGDISILAATSSFGGGGSDITSLNSYTESADSRFTSLESTTSSLQNEVDAIKIFTQSADIVLGNLEAFTSSQEDLNVTFATTGSNNFVGNQSITDGQFNVITGSGQLTSSLSFTHNVTSPGDGNATLELRHNNDLYNDDVALQLKTDFAGAYVLYEENGIPYSVLSVQSLANKNIYIQRDTRLFQKSLTIDNDLTVTGSLLSSGSANFLGDVSASIFTGSFVGDGSGLIDITLPSGILSSSETNFTDFSQSVDTRIDNIVSGTGFATTSSFNELTQSFNSFTSSQENLNVTFATTGSNTFVGNQGITGSIVVSGSISQKGVGGVGNIVIGENPLTNLTSDAIYNVIIGQDAGVLNSSGSSNVYIGRNAGILNQIGNSNVMIGTYAGYNAKNSQNVYIGESAGAQNISGQYNIAIGHQAGYNNKVNLNTFIGWQSGFQNTSGSGNTFVGERSGESNTIGNNNSFFGGSSGRATSVGSNNTFIGQNAGQQNTSGSFSTFVGSQAGAYTTTGNNNTFVGAQAGILNTLGYSNAFFGDNSGYNNTTAYENTFVGSFSGYENRTGVRNTFIGLSAGQNTRVGNDNTYIGHRAGNSNISGSNNTLVGLHAGFNITSGSDNTFLGKNSGYYISDGTSEVSGSNRSVFIGTNVKSNGHDETNQIVIGYDAVGNGSNTVTIGNDDITDTYVKGTLRTSTAILAQVSASYNFADDTAAAGGGVPLGGLYHTSGSIKIRLV